MHIIYVYEKVKIWSNYIFPFKYKKCFQGCKKCTVVKHIVNKDLYKNPAQILFFSALLQTFNSCLLFTLDCALGVVRGQPDINSPGSH